MATHLVNPSILSDCYDSLEGCEKVSFLLCSATVLLTTAVFFALFAHYVINNKLPLGNAIVGMTFISFSALAIILGTLSSCHAPDPN